MTDGQIEYAGVADAVQAVADSQKYAFLIGAGCSAPEPADIPTSGTLIERWKKERYRYVDPDEDRDDWVESMEESIDDSEKYGFWFEERHTSRGERREFIQGLVEDATPTLGHIILAKLMSEEYVPLTLTPNFDDLLYDPLYQFMGIRPHLVNHAAIAAGFKIDSERPTIVKLHGDYLYDNLRNTGSETSKLEEGMEDALQRTASEYGLIVVGYSGGDESIMQPLLETELSEYGIYWCTRDPDDLGDEVEELLAQAEEGYAVEIDGFVSMMTEFEDKITGVELPTHEELVERGKERADLFMEILDTSLESAAEEEEEYVDKQELKQAAKLAHYINQDYKLAKDLWNDVIDLDPEDAAAIKERGVVKAILGEYDAAIEDYNRAIDLDLGDKVTYSLRGTAKVARGDYEAAIDDFDKALDLDPKYISAYLGRGAAKRNLEEYQAAIEDFVQVLEYSSEDPNPLLGLARTRIETGDYLEAREDARQAKLRSNLSRHSAWSLLFLLISTVLLDEHTNDLEQEFRSVCEDDFYTLFWNYYELDSWLESAELDPDEREQIEEWLGILREHKPD